MDKKCLKCGKKLGLFGKVQIKDGFICRDCAKQYKEALNSKTLNFKDLSIEDLEKKHEEVSKKNTMLIAATIIFCVIGIVFLAVSGGGNGEDSQIAPSKETVVNNEMTAGDKTKNKKAEEGSKEEKEAKEAVDKNPVPLKPNEGFTVLQTVYLKLKEGMTWSEVEKLLSRTDLHYVSWEVYSDMGKAVIAETEVISGDGAEISYDSKSDNIELSFFKDSKDDEKHLFSKTYSAKNGSRYDCTCWIRCEHTFHDNLTETAIEEGEPYEEPKEWESVKDALKYTIDFKKNAKK